MTAGETWESCLDEIRGLPSVQKYGDDGEVSMYNMTVHPTPDASIPSNAISRPGSSQKTIK